MLSTIRKLFILETHILKIEGNLVTQSLRVSNTNDSWENTRGVYSTWLELRSKSDIRVGTTLKVKKSDIVHNDTGYLVVLSIEDVVKLHCKWVPIATYQPIVSGDQLAYLDSPTENLRIVKSVSGEENISSTGTDMAYYETELIKHLDVLPGAGADIRSYREALSIWRINFLTSPTLRDAFNYPKALYSRNLHKFWYYEQRKPAEYNGDGTFDSEVKPTAFGAAYFSLAARWYLSRRDYGSTAYCNTYTPNYDTGNLGKDDNLYSIVNVSPALTGDSYLDYPCMRFAMGTKKNLRFMPIFSDFNSIMLSSRLPKFGSFKEMTFDSILYIYQTTDSPTSVLQLQYDFLSDPEEAIDKEIHGTYHNGSDYSVGVMNWKNVGLVELSDSVGFGTRPICRKFYANLSEQKLGRRITPSGSDYAEYSYRASNDTNNKYILVADQFGIIAKMFVMKEWDDNSEAFNQGPGGSIDSVRGAILRRHNMFYDEGTSQENADERQERERLSVISIRTNASDIAYFSIASPSGAGATTVYEFPIVSMRKLGFRIAGGLEDGYFFANTKDNTLIRWDGEISAVTTILGDGLPTVEGDFGQYETLLKLDTPYEEIFGFSSGVKLHPASATIKAGRNILWKLSKSLAFHIAVADFENLSVWDALSQFAELTDSIMSFDRFGNFHFETRPSVSGNTPYSFTFDKLAIGNVISIDKKPAFNHTYNYIEIIPSKPVLPLPKIDLVTNSDINAVTANHDLFIKDHKLDVEQKDRNKRRPVINAYQKDYERKRVLLICNSGQYDPPGDIEKGLYSRWKYQMISDRIELRLAVAVQTNEEEIVVNHIPYDDVAGKLAIDAGDFVYIGNEGPYTVKEQTGDAVGLPDISVPDRIIRLTSAFTTNYSAGLPVSVVKGESFKATGSGQFEGEYTYSPKTFYVEIGEWVFDEEQVRPKVRLMTPLGTGDSHIIVSDISLFPAQGYITINGEIIEYTSIDRGKLTVGIGLASDHPVDSIVYLMPLRTIFEAWRIGGIDEVGPSCLDEYHLYDPDEDEISYYDSDPLIGGKPITALEFYWEGQLPIYYMDIGENVTENTNYRARHRTFAEMRIQFNGFRFSDGDKIDLDFHGIKLEPQVHLKKTYTDYQSIERNGLRQYPVTANRFFNNKTALITGKRIITKLANIGASVKVVAKIEDITMLDFVHIARIIDHDLFSALPSNEVRGYISSIKINELAKTATVTAFIEQL
jgi:hypothetical protein